MTASMEIKDTTIYHKPRLETWEQGGLHFFLDGDSPNWVAVDGRGARLLEWVNGRRSFAELVRLYSETHEMDLAKSWLHCHTFVKDALKAGILSPAPSEGKPYPGRSRCLKPEKLKEFWIHLTQTCNLACTHCLVSSGPRGEKGLGAPFYKRAVDESCDLGVERYYFTGGEPFVRADVFELIRYVTETKGKELIVLTNATLMDEARLGELAAMDRGKLKFQVSLDGTTPAANDPIRGSGVFQKATAGLKALSALGFEASLTAVVTRDNLEELKALPELAQRLGARSVHLMWPHKRGRILETTPRAFPSESELLAMVRQVKTLAGRTGVLFDNVESLKLRVNGRPGVKYDLGMMGWESLCLYMDGQVYPSAAMAGHPGLSLGRLNGKTLRELWLQSEAASAARNASVVQKEHLARDPFKYLTGGGDMEHSYFFSANGKAGSYAAADPYYPLYVAMIRDVMLDLAESKRKALNPKSGFGAPVVLHAMGEGAVTCSEDAMGWLASGKLPEVKLLHSNCVLSFDVEKPYKAVREFYGKAAEKPQEELCCPVKYDDADIRHIPRDVIDRFYGCGSPISMAAVKAGETTLDLGCGAGIDCFIAAKKVGAAGKVIGVDMTDPMLAVAERCKKSVADALGYDVVEFKKGFLEDIPVPDRSADLVTSNCVINLSPDKNKVFAEVWRILKDAGRLVVADIVSDRPVPLSLQAHQDLWGECISGSLCEGEFLSQLEKAGFYGIALIKKAFWKEVEGVRFYSITVRGFKFEKKAGCSFAGQKAVYLGPYKAAMDEEGHLFPRGEAIEVCTDTAAKLKAQPYAEQFQVLEENAGPSIPIQALPQAGEGCCGGSSCC